MMTRDDIIRMALDAGFERNSLGWTFTYGRLDYHLERFAGLVAAAEREECAKFIEQEYVRQFDEPWRDNLAKAIRARGQA